MQDQQSASQSQSAAGSSDPDSHVPPLLCPACWRGAKPGWPKPKPWCGRFWKPCARAAIRRCSNTRASSTRSTARRWRCPQPICSAPARACRRISALRSRPPPPTSARSPRCSCPAETLREVSPGLQLGQVVRPLDTVAAYIPAGRYPLPSTLMMTVIPAQVAGVPNICVACPAPRAGDPGHGAASGCRAGVSNGRRASHRGLRLRHAHGARARTASSDPATSTWPPPRNCSRAMWASTSWPALPKS